MATRALAVQGTVQRNANAYSQRIKQHRETYENATGMPNLHDGTLNVWTDGGEHIAIWPHFQIDGAVLSEPDQDQLFEPCTIIVAGREFPAFRVRPYCRPDGQGGNGDHCLEIIAETIPVPVGPGTRVTVVFTRESKP